MYYAFDACPLSLTLWQFNLGWKLALVEKGFAVPSLLRSYTAERVPVISEVLKRTTNIHDKTQVMRNDGSGLVAWDRGGPLKMLGINYRTSPIVVDTVNKKGDHPERDLYESRGGVRTGDRAPDAPGLRVLKGDGDLGEGEGCSKTGSRKASEAFLSTFFDILQSRS